jgi:hypothetical protein
MKFNNITCLITSFTFTLVAALPQHQVGSTLSGTMTFPHFLAGGSRGLEQGTKGLVEGLEGYSSESSQWYDYGDMPQQSPHPQ